METHLVMKNNAMFLLELSGGSPRRVTSNQSPPDLNSAFPPPGPFQCLHSLGVHPSALRDELHFPHDEVILRRRDSDANNPSRVSCTNKQFYNM